MNNKFKSKIQRGFEKLYYFLTFSLIYLGSMIAGLVFLSFGGAHVLLYKLSDMLSRERYKEKVKIYKFFKENFINYTMKYVKVSLLYVSLLLIIGIDIFYFSTSISPLYTGLFYLMIILGFVIINAMEISFLLMAKYPELTFKEVAQNSVSLIVVNIIDTLLLNVILGLITYTLYKISGVLILILLPGIAIELNYYFFNKMLKKKSLTYLLFNIR